MVAAGTGAVLYMDGAGGTWAPSIGSGTFLTPPLTSGTYQVSLTECNAAGCARTPLTVAVGPLREWQARALRGRCRCRCRCGTGGAAQQAACAQLAPAPHERGGRLGTMSRPTLRTPLRAVPPLAPVVQTVTGTASSLVVQFNRTYVYQYSGVIA